MFTGIVQGIGTVLSVTHRPGLTQFVIELPATSEPPKQGASVALAGTCMTVVSTEGPNATFDAMEETLNRTTLGTWIVGTRLNVERSARYGDEIGGHILSGHVSTIATIVAIEKPANNYIVRFSIPAQYMKYLLPKGFVALDGASLTLVDVDLHTNTFTVHLIPETLRVTTFAERAVGGAVNVELDTMTQAIVDTTERILSSQPRQ